MLKRFSITKPGTLLKKYDGKMFVYLTTATHTSTFQKLAVFKDVDTVWATPLSDFGKFVVVDGVYVPQYMSEKKEKEKEKYEFYGFSNFYFA